MIKKIFAGIAIVLCLGAPAQASAPSHALTLYGEPKYKKDFKHFDYVNVKAPKGGEIKLAENGNFDSLNHFIAKGVKAPALPMMFDTLMTSSLDEPQSMYGLVAESVEVADDKSWVEFTLRPQAKFHDGSPITPDDVVFTFEALKTKGDPTYRILYAAIADAKKTGERKVRFTLTDKDNRELPMIVAGMPVLSKAYYQKVDFEKSTLEPPLASGPYRIASVDPGKTIVYERVKDYWAKDLPVNVGQYNFDTMRYDMYRDENVSLEALKAGAYDFRQEYIARSWATGYDSPALKSGKLVKRLIEHDIPQGMQGFIFNTRQAKFSDRRVREAIGLTLDFEWLNKTLFYSAYARNDSYFMSTPFAAKGLPEGAELELLKPLKDQLPPAIFTEEYHVPKTDGSGNAREQLKRADALLNEAGWVIRDGKRVNEKTGEALNVEFMLRQPTMERIAAAMRKHLDRLGIGTEIRYVDDAQYQKRLDEGDFDIVSLWINRGVFYPGNEQTTYWHSSQADVKASNNIGGVKLATVDTVLNALVNAKNYDALVAAGRALDRILLFEHIMIPHWHSNSYRIAYWDKFGLPEVYPKYDLGLKTWWVKDAGK